MIDRDFMKTLTETPSVGTACGPMVNVMTDRFGEAWNRTFVSDAFCLFQKGAPEPQRLKAVFIAHLDEIGGCVYGPRAEGGFHTRVWGNTPAIFHNASLQAFDYLAESAEEAYPVESELITVGEEIRLALFGEHIRPYRTGFTFRQETTFSGDLIDGKALDPRVTAYAVAEAVRQLNTPEIGALFVMAEECAMDVARKAVTFLQRSSPDLRLIVNADVPWIENIGEGQLDLPAIRIFEGRNFIDPMFGIRASEVMTRRGVAHHLSAARSGSQTMLFTPLAPTLSLALPSDDVHKPRVRMSLTGTERCTDLLHALGDSLLKGELEFVSGR